MTQAKIDLRQFLVPKKKVESKSSFVESDNDYIWFPQYKGVLMADVQNRVKSISNFAAAGLSVGQYEKSPITGAWTFPYFVGGNNALYVIDAFGDPVNYYNVPNIQHIGIAPKIALSIPAIENSGIDIDKIFEISHIKDANGKERHLLQMGAYLSKMEHNPLKHRLEKEYNGGCLERDIKATGQVYLRPPHDNDEGVNFYPEFEYKGDKYVRIANGLPYSPDWVLVQPLKFEILNWNKLPKFINKNGRSKLWTDKIIELEAVESILSARLYDSLIETRRFLNGLNNEDCLIDYREFGFLKQAFDLSRQPLKEYTIPSQQRQINEFAFAGCVELNKIIIPNTVSYVGESAFSGLFGNTQIAWQLQDNHYRFAAAALNNTNFHNMYFSQDCSWLTLTNNDDDKLEKTCFKVKYDKDTFAKLIANNMYAKNYINASQWMAEGKTKFIPQDYVLETFPNDQLDNFFVNNNHLRWRELVKTVGFDSILNQQEKINSLRDLMKIYYAIGGFSDNPSDRDKAFKYILDNVVSMPDGEQDPRRVGARIHQKFSGIQLKREYNPKFAQFFMKYYADDPDFMVGYVIDEDGYVVDGEEVDYLCMAHNSFDIITRAYPHMAVNGNSSRGKLTPQFVLDHCHATEYEDVDDGNEKLAEIVGRYGYDESSFAEMQDVYNKAKNMQDNAVLAVDSPKTSKGISYRVLDKDDPLGFVLGDITNCCQCWDDAAETCVEDGYLNPNAGFIVFEEDIKGDGESDNIEPDRKRILAQAYTWYDYMTKTVCLDNIEIPDTVAEKLLKNDKSGKGFTSKKFMEAVEDCAVGLIARMAREGHKVEQVTTGAGYNDLYGELEGRYIKESEPKACNRNYDGYSDADDVQYVIMTYDEATKRMAESIRQDVLDSEKNLDDISKTAEVESVENEIL